MIYFRADHRFLQASIVELVSREEKKLLMMMMMVNILIMSKIKVKVFVKKNNNKQIYFIVKRLTEQHTCTLHDYISNRIELLVEFSFFSCRM